jgi:hypothetical protein
MPLEASHPRISLALALGSSSEGKIVDAFAISIHDFSFAFSREEYLHTIATAIKYPKHFGIFILYVKRYRVVPYISKLDQLCSRGSGQSQGH